MFYINGEPIIQFVDKATRCQAAQWFLTSNNEVLSQQHDATGRSLWRALRQFWIDVYMGLPDIILQKAGRTFLAHAIHANTYMQNSLTDSVSVEAETTRSKRLSNSTTILNIVTFYHKKKSQNSKVILTSSKLQSKQWMTRLVPMVWFGRFFCMERFHA